MSGRKHKDTTVKLDMPFEEAIRKALPLHEL